MLEEDVGNQGEQKPAERVALEDAREVPEEVGSGARVERAVHAVERVDEGTDADGDVEHVQDEVHAPSQPTHV